MRSAARIAASTFLFAAPLLAGIIDVSDAQEAYLRPHAKLSIRFGVGSYALASHGGSPYPAEIRFSILGPQPEYLATAEGGSAQYVPGFLFEGWLESLDGSYSIPLVDPDALRMGLPQGMLLATPGVVTVGGTAMGVSVIDGFVFLEPAASEAVFGANIGSFDGGARIRIANRGAGFTIGLGELLPVHAAVSTTGLGPGASFTMGGGTGTIEIMNPEPSTWLLMAGAGMLLAVGWGRRPRLRPASRPALPGVDARRRSGDLPH